MNIGAMVQRLIASGADPAVAAEVAAELFVAGVQSAPTREPGDVEIRSPGAERTARWRAKRETSRVTSQASQASQNVTCDADETKKNVPPHPPIEKTTIPNGIAAAGAASTDEADLFRRGKTLLGANSGGVVTKLLRAKGGNIALARSAIEMAATKADPREYLGAIIRGRDKDDLRARGEAW